MIRETKKSSDSPPQTIIEKVIGGIVSEIADRDSKNLKGSCEFVCKVEGPFVLHAFQDFSSKDVVNFLGNFNVKVIGAFQQKQIKCKTITGKGGIEKNNEYSFSFSLFFSLFDSDKTMKLFFYIAQESRSSDEYVGCIATEEKASWCTIS